jgi:hypothetical protein
MLYDFLHYKNGGKGGVFLKLFYFKINYFLSMDFIRPPPPKTP